MRKIRKWNTTFTNRENTNDKIYEEVNTQVKNEGKKKIITTFVQSYKKSKRTRIIRTISDTEEIHNISFEPNLHPRIPPNRKQGRPKYKWTERALIEFWNDIRKDIPNFTHIEYDKNNETQYVFNFSKLRKKHEISTREASFGVWRHFAPGALSKS